jgi:hypothetical protein
MVRLKTGIQNSGFRIQNENLESSHNPQALASFAEGAKP